jgi:hypothetical protein
MLDANDGNWRNLAEHFFGKANSQENKEISKSGHSMQLVELSSQG